MKAIYKGKKISSILSVLPEQEVFFDNEVDNYDFPVKQTMRLKRLMGFDKHRISKSTSTVADFAVFGMKYILDNKWISKDDIGAIVVVSLCPDYFVPHIGNIVQGELGLADDILCLDIAQGCCGFLVGLSQAFMLLDHMEEGKKVVVINGDVLSHKISKKDRNEYPLIGDGATITIVENDCDAEDIYYEMHMDGSRGEALIIPAGGFRMPSTDETGVLKASEDGNFRALNHMHMDGTAVFNFVQTEVPTLIESVLRYAGLNKDDIDLFLFHQPNIFMLEKLAQKLGVAAERMPMNLVAKYGNTSGSSIPMVTTLNYSSQLVDNRYKCCLSGFGSGLAWGAMIMELGNLMHCETIVSNL